MDSVVAVEIRTASKPQAARAMFRTGRQGTGNHARRHAFIKFDESRTTGIALALRPLWRRRSCGEPK
jgi:hypothetical protein